MPKIEIDEDEFNRLNALRGVAAKIVANPAAKKLLEQAHKTVDPNAVTPTLDAEASINNPIEELRKEFRETVGQLTKSQEEKERQARINEIASKQSTDKANLRKEGYTDEGVKAVEKIMEEKGLLDVMDAVAIFERNNPPPTPATPGVGSWGFSDMNGESDKNIQDLITTRGQNDQIADRMAREALNEFRGAMSIGRR
jgi:hypothetical protein